MSRRPDLGDRVNWSRLLRSLAGEDAPGEPPMASHGPDDPTGPAWAWCLSGASAAAFADLPGLGPETDLDAPLTLPREDLAIEVWTECELAVLHAGFRRYVALVAGNPAEVEPGTRALGRRLARAIAWHRERTQPDNATTHPWAIHAWLELGLPVAEAIDDAATMLHAVESAAMLSGEGRPDPLSRWILADAVATFESLDGDRIGSSRAASVLDRETPHDR